MPTITNVRQIEVRLDRKGVLSYETAFLLPGEYATWLRQFVSPHKSAQVVTLKGVHELAADFGQWLLDKEYVANTELVQLVSERRQYIRGLAMTLVRLNKSDKEVLFSDEDPLLSEEARREAAKCDTTAFTYDKLLALSPATVILLRNS